MEQRIGRGPGNLNSNDWNTGGDSVDFQQLISMFSVLGCAVLCCAVLGIMERMVSKV